jgi:DNA-binding LytR/AlgR family response regulator
VKILVVDNDPSEALLLKELCRVILGNRLEHFAIATSVLGAAAHLADTAFDVVLLDPKLLPSDGMQLLSIRTVSAFQTIIVSARTDLALRAFEFGVLDFVPKPICRERLARALRRVAPMDPSKALLAVRRLGRIDFIAVDDLLYVEGADKYSELVLSNGQRNFYDKCLGRLEATLPRSFVRIHKSFLVRFNKVFCLHVLKGSRYFAELKDGTRLPVGRSRYEKVKARLIWPRHPRG